MSRLLAVAVLLLAAASAAGCSSPSALAASEGELGRDVAPLEVWGDVERLEFSKQIQVRLPARLVVADVSRDSRRRSEDEDAQRLVALLDTLSPDAVTWSDVGSLRAFADENARQSSRLAHLREAASRQHADLMLVVERRETLSESHNALAALKLLLVGFLFATEEDELRMTVRGAIVDVRNGLVYATFDDHRETDVTSSVWSEERAVRDAFRTLWADSAAEMKTAAATKLVPLATDGQTGR